MKINKKLTELIGCYIEQYGYDVTMGQGKYIDLVTVMRLKEIKNDK